MPTTELIPVDPHSPDRHSIERAAKVLRKGGLVAFPTETVYGLGANALNPEAVARIYEAKGRPSNNPLIVHVPDASVATRVFAKWPQTASLLAERFWPGPLTLVLPRRLTVPDIVTGGGPTVAVRVPAHPVALALIQAAGVPVAAPSANRSQRISPTSAEHVMRDLAGRIDIVLDGGPTTRGLESTVLDLTTEPPRLLRPGPIAPAEIEEITGPLERAHLRVKGGKALPSPGMMTRHYAPRAVLELAPGDGRERAAELAARGLLVGWVVPGPAEGAPEGVTAVALPASPKAYGAHLYAALHRLDDMGVDRIVAAMPPDTDEWLAVRDRLRRASAKE